MINSYLVALSSVCHSTIPGMEVGWPELAVICRISFHSNFQSVCSENKRPRVSTSLPTSHKVGCMHVHVYHVA